MYETLDTNFCNSLGSDHRYCWIYSFILLILETSNFWPSLRPALFAALPCFMKTETIPHESVNKPTGPLYGVWKLLHHVVSNLCPSILRDTLSPTLIFSFSSSSGEILVWELPKWSIQIISPFTVLPSVSVKGRKYWVKFFC